MSVFDNIKSELKQRADLNGDGKVDRADIEATVNRARLAAGDLVTKRGALGACLICFGVGLAIGIVGAKVLG